MFMPSAVRKNTYAQCRIVEMASPVFSVAASQGCPDRVGRETRTDTCTMNMKNQVCKIVVV